MDKENRYKNSLLALIILLIGIITGMVLADYFIIGQRLRSAEKLKAVIIGETVYDLQERK